MYLSKDVTPEVRKRQLLELRIMCVVVNDALAAGYSLGVDDGGEELALKPTTNKRAIWKALYNTDTDVLVLEKDGQTAGWVRFVYGNDGWDVLSDYTINLEGLLTAANALAYKLADDNEQGENNTAWMECPVCGADNEPMGVLGRRVHYRCRHCGMEFSLLVKG